MNHVTNGDPRQLEETLKVIFDNRQEGDLLMDVVKNSWTALEKAAEDKDGWRSRVHALKNMTRTTIKVRKVKKSNTNTTHQAQTQRFTFLLSKKHPKRKSKTKKQLKYILHSIKVCEWTICTTCFFKVFQSAEIFKVTIRLKQYV